VTNASSRPPSLYPATSLLAVCAFVLWWRVWHAAGTQINAALNFDAFMYWMPLVREAAAQWLAGSPPLWNPYQALGTPLLATLQAGCAYPLNAPYLFLDPGWAWICVTVLHHGIAGLGFFIFCQRLGLSRAAALVGAASFSFSWLILLKSYDQPQFMTIAWLPALFACGEHLLAVPTVAATFRLAVVWALQLLAGHPETIACSAVLFGSYTGVRVLTTAWHAPHRAVTAGVASAAAAGLTLAFTAFQWLPTWELVRHSVRAVGALTPAQQMLGAADVRQLFSTSPGCAMLAIALLGAVTWRERTRAWFFATAAVMLATLAVAPSTPLFELTRYLPTGTWFRAWGRLLILWPLCIGVLTAAGAEMFTSSTLTRRRLVVCSLMVTVGVRLFLTRPSEFQRAVGLAMVFDVLPLLAISLLPHVTRRMPAILQPHVNSIAVLVFFCAVPPLLNPTLVDHLAPQRIATVYSPYAPLFEQLRAAAPARVLSLLSIAEAHTWAKLGTYFEVPVLNDLEPLSLTDFRAFRIGLSGANPLWFAAVFMGEVSPPEGRFDARHLNLAGVRFVVTDTASEPQLRRWMPEMLQRRDSGGPAGVSVYENRAALPRAFFRAITAARPQGTSCVSALNDVRFDPSRELLLDAPLATAPAAAAPAPASDVRISSYRPSEVRIQMSSDQPGFVVLTDAFFPGWTADVDGVAAPIVRGDCFFRAVRVAAGSHVVTFQYSPPSFRFGAIISLVAFGFAVGGVIVAACARRQERR
jgi:hypothetical protein